MTVVSRKEGKTSAAVWDLDDVAKQNEWVVYLPDDLSNLSCVGKLQASGTLVLWEKLDRLIGGYSNDTAKRAEVINLRLAECDRLSAVRCFVFLVSQES